MLWAIVSLCFKELVLILLCTCRLRRKKLVQHPQHKKITKILPYLVMVVLLVVVVMVSGGGRELQNGGVH